MTGFDDKARDWDTDPVKIARAEAVAAGIRAGVPLRPTDAALEIGCGTGLLSMALRPYLAGITLVDSSPGMLAMLAEKITPGGGAVMTPLLLDLDRDPLPAGPFQLIHALMALHHVPDIDRLLVDCHARLTPGGHLCIADLDRESGAYHDPGFQGHHGFDRDDLGERLARAGFGSVRFSTVFTMRKQTSSGLRDFPLFLAIARKCQAGSDTPGSSHALPL